MNGPFYFCGSSSDSFYISQLCGSNSLVQLIQNELQGAIDHTTILYLLYALT